MSLYTTVNSKDFKTVKNLFYFPTLLYLLLFIITTAHASGQRSHNQIPEFDRSEKIPPTQRPYVINNKKYYPIPSAEGYDELGIASWYGPDFHGKHTSNGEIYNMHSMTAAHKTLPMNTMLLIKNLNNGRETVVRINDRGPFVRGRIVDLSYKAAQVLGMDNQGIAQVRAVALGEEAVKSQGASPTLIYQNLSVGNFYVQIGAFSNENNALALQKRFTDAGYATVIQEAQESQPILYRVQVYVGQTLQQAKRSEQALLERGYTGAFTIAR